MKDILLKLMFNILKIYISFTIIYHFFKKELKNLKEYVIHIRNLKQALNQGLVLKKLYRVIKFDQKSWLKPDIDINTELRKNRKNNFKNLFSS